MRHDKKNQQNKRDCREALSTELNRYADKLVSLQVRQLTGDHTEETARQVNIIGYHIEVLKNRLNGRFKFDYRNEIEHSIPKSRQI